MNSVKLTMNENTVLRIDGDCRGALISCEKGMVSVTQQNDIEDHILSGEDIFRISRKGRVLTWALSDASLEILWPHVNSQGVLRYLRRLISYKSFTGSRKGGRHEQ